MPSQGARGSLRAEAIDTVAGSAAPIGRNGIAAWVRFAHGRWPRLVNLGLLIGGLGIGQGSIFVVQTWLLAQGKFEILSLFATHYSLAVFAIILIDGGSSAIIARILAQVASGHRDQTEFWHVVSETMAFRLLVAALVAIGAAIYALTLANDGFSRLYALFALPGFLVWAANGAGLLDGLRLSGLGGMTGAIAYVASAAALALVRDASPETAGAIIGAAFSVGYVLTVAAQWLVLRRCGWPLRLRKVTAAGFGRAVKDGAAMLFQLMPGQAVLRIQLVLSTIYLGAETTALFAYVKQLVTMAAMIVAMLLRVEFPRLVQVLAVAKGRPFRAVLDAQRMALYCALALTIGAMAASACGQLMPRSHFGAAATTLLIFSPTILTISLCLITTQGLLALGAYGAAARASVISAVFGIALSGLLVKLVGIYAFLCAELVSQLVNLVLIYRYMPSRKPERAAWLAGDHDIRPTLTT